MIMTAPSHVGRHTLNNATLTKLGFQVDIDGIEAHEDAARILVDAAKSRGIRPVLVDVLSNPAEPAAARTRAFGRLAFALAS